MVMSPAAEHSSSVVFYHYCRCSLQDSMAIILHDVDLAGVAAFYDKKKKEIGCVQRQVSARLKLLGCSFFESN